MNANKRLEDDYREEGRRGWTSGGGGSEVQKDGSLVKGVLSESEPGKNCCSHYSNSMVFI